MFDFRQIYIYIYIYIQLCSYYIMFNIVTLRLGSCLDCGLGRWVKVCQGRKVGKLSGCRSLLLALGMDPVVAEHGISRAYPAEWPELLFCDAWHDLVM